MNITERCGQRKPNFTNPILEKSQNNWSTMLLSKNTHQIGSKTWRNHWVIVWLFVGKAKLEMIIKSQTNWMLLEPNWAWDWSRVSLPSYLKQLLKQIKYQAVDILRGILRKGTLKRIDSSRGGNVRSFKWKELACKAHMRADICHLKPSMLVSLLN